MRSITSLHLQRLHADSIKEHNPLRGYYLKEFCLVLEAYDNKMMSHAQMHQIKLKRAEVEQLRRELSNERQTISASAGE